MNWFMFFAEKKFVWSAKKKKGFWFKLNFLTLTLSEVQRHSDTYIVTHMLQPMLRYLQRSHNVNNYVWKAEIQPKRLSVRNERCIHFHITTDKFIPWRTLRNKWNSIQAAHGYGKFSDDNNSTDIHSVRNDKEIVRYMANYIAKKPTTGEMAVTCKTWGCSQSLSQMTATIREEEVDGFSDEVNRFSEWFVKEITEVKYATLFLNKFSVEDRMPVQLGLQLRKCWEIFSAKDNGVKKYTIFD